MNAIHTTNGVTKAEASHLSMADLIAAHPFAKGLSHAIVEKIADFAMEAEFSAEETIFREGDPANRFYLILEGTVALDSFVEGRGVVELQKIGAGDVLGWSWLFPPYYWHFDARAVTPVKAIFLYGTPLRERCEEDHDLGYELLKRTSAIVVNRLQTTRRKLLEAQRTNGNGSK